MTNVFCSRFSGRINRRPSSDSCFCSLRECPIQAAGGPCEFYLLLVFCFFCFSKCLVELMFELDFFKATTIAAFARMTVEDSRKLLSPDYYPSWVVFSQRQKVNCFTCLIHTYMLILEANLFSFLKYLVNLA